VTSTHTASCDGSGVHLCIMILFIPDLTYPFLGNFLMRDDQLDVVTRRRPDDREGSVRFARINYCQKLDLALKYSLAPSR
jgi:hypothetical protein